MKTLDQFNTERAREYVKVGKPHKNNIMCPTCGAELWDTNPLVTLTTSPPKKEVGCRLCGYRGFRIA